MALFELSEWRTALIPTAFLMSFFGETILTYCMAIFRGLVMEYVWPWFAFPVNGCVRFLSGEIIIIIAG